MQKVITVGKRLVPTEQIAFVEPFDGSSNPDFKPDRPFKARVVLVNRDTVLTVRADIVDKVQAPDVTNEILPKLAPITAGLPYGYRIETGGAIEESAKANVALVAVFPAIASTSTQNPSPISPAT